ncbi:VCBS domain-containing protein [Shewanella xiamenensis]|uniref:VCBS domain-containing protein n=1 Tax=Shewanella xiamenensis TaxID=332186 RepID=UPI00255AC90D|nr:VCBS domain-containing protein [Shewanella xiamenensis]MDL3984738.1 VCBS domain-containing protein [Shewanella xiamenensis]
MSPKKPLTLSTAKRKSRISAKLAKKSEIAAKKLDKDVAKLKAKEFRESEVQNSATPDIVATQSWRLATHATTQLANTEQSTEQKANAQSTTADIDNRHSTTQTASTDPEKTLLEQQQQANAAETQTFPKFQDYGSSESTHLGQGPHFDDTQPPLVTLSQLPEIGDIKQQIEPTALTVSMARTTLTQSVRPPIISTEQHHTPLSIDEQVTHQSIKEDAPAASISGKLHAHGEAITSLQWTVAEHQGQFGRLDIDPITGEWHYQLDNNAPKTDALAEGEHQTEQFTVTVSGPNGEQVSTLIIIDVEGSNDLPQILGSHLASINAADSLQTVMGQLRSVDPDHNDVITWAVLDGQGQYGQLSINPLTGQWQYQLNNHANATLALVSGQQVTETFTVTATDLSGHPVSQQVSIQVNGADDAAIIQGKITGLVTEDTQANNGQLTVSGQLSIQDPDKDQAHFSADSLQGQFGYLTIDVNGHWIYNADNTQATIQSLRSGEHLTDTFIIHSADGTAQNITVTINGTDDKAEISGTTSASLTEDSDTYQGMLRANGNLTITDNDHGPHLFTATEQSGQFGTLTIDELGHWTYIADNSQTAIQALKTGESITDTLVVQTQDGTQQTISITIHGTDDHSVIRGTSVVRVFEDKRLSQGQLHTDGQLWVSNPDTGRAGFAAEQRQGQFGVLSINSDGHWTYIADNNNPSIQALKHGEFVTETLFVKALDGTSQKIEILIKGADDKAIIGGTDTATLVEDQSPQHGQLQAHGTLTITDPDAGQAQFSALTDVAGSAGYGHFSIDATGNWTYTVDNTLTAIQQLNTGEHLTDSLTISSADGTNHTLKVTITGSNDAPVVAQSLVTTTATEDTAFSFSIPAGTFADIDTGDTLILSTGSLPAWLHFDAATGTFSGTPTNGDVGTLQVTITATDGSGAQVSTIFVLNVDNTNDAPTLTPIATVHATEDGAQVTGQFTATDPDSGDKLTFSIAQPVDGLSVNTDGSWRFDPSHASYQHLAAGQTLTLTIPVTVTDAAGATSSQDLVIKLNGSNDGATIGGVSTGSAKEDNAQITTGQLIVADVDDGEAHFVAQTDTAGTYGHFSLSADGRWSYQLDNSKPEIQQLSEGVMLHENFTVHSADGTTHTISVDIVGTNDAPVLAAQSQSVTEDGTKLSGQMVATDVDTGDSQTFSTTAQTAGFTLNADGSYSFDPTDAAYQHLATGQTETLTIPITVTDSTGATSTANLTITLTGSNDGAVISGTDAGTVTEDTQLTTGGQLTVTDIDDQESAFTAQANTAGSYGSFTLAADGHWTYTLDNKNSAVQALGQNATLTDSLTVQSVDGTTHTITVNINGHDDGAVIAGVDSGTVTEDANLTAGQLETHGQLTISDPDAGQDHFTAQTHVAGSYGTFSLDADGQWRYSADNSQSAIQQLKAGETLTDSLTVQSVGGTTHTITVTLTGTNDAPVLTAQSQSITEDGTKLTGQMVATDVDTGDTLTFSLANAVDGFTLNADGSYSFDPSNAAYQHLAAGQTQTLTIPVSVTDSAGATATQQLVITVTGSNDGAIISGTDAGTVTEDTQLTTGGQLTVTDIDDQESAFTAQAKTAGSYGSFTLAADGHWTYTLNNSLPAVQALGQNGTLTDSLTVQSVDGTTHTITVTINGHDDGALIAGIDSGTVTEDANLTAGQLETHGQLTISDPDAGQDHFTAQTHVAGSYGSFSLDADGQWNYSADNSQTAIQQLKAGETLTDSLTVQSVGGTTHTVTVTITGSNDAPVLTAQSQSVTEDGNKLSGQMVATDVDTGDSQTFSTTAQTAGFTLNADGSYSFDPANAAYQHLAAGQTETLTIPVSVTDSTGATSTANLTITLTGSNDGAIISGTDASAVTEDTQLTTGGQLTVTDIDDQESAFTAQAKTAGSYGSFTLAADGHWTYTLNNSLPAVQALGQNATLTDSLAVQSMDGTTHTITVTINGHDDGAVIAGVDSGTVTEDCNVTTGKITTSGQLTISDPDAGQDHFTAQTNVAGSYGTFSLDQAGHWTYVSDNSQTAVQQLKAGETLTDSLTVQSVGGTTHTVTVTLTGSNDAPVLTAQSQSVTEDGNKLSGQMVATDVDTGDTLTFSLANAVDGFTLNADGSYSFDPANAAYQHLAAGQTETLTIPVSVTDSAGATATQLLVITVTGSNDGAIISGTDAGWVIEDTQLTTGGQLTVTDIDDQESAFTAQANTAGSYGNFTLAADGHWTYTLDNKNSAVQALGQNATLTDSLTVQSMDGTTHKVTVTINGHDDGAVIAGVDSGAVTEDSNVKISGLISFSSTLTVSDIDTGEARFPLQQGAGSLGLGNFLLAPTGGWGYSVDNNLPEIQQLKAGQTLVETYTFHSADGSQHTVTVTITGSNDAPVLTAQRQSVSEDGTKLNGQMIATDVDTGDSQTFSTTAQTAGFTLNADGSYSFDPTDAAYQHLAAGQTETLSIPITVTDSSGATSTANLTITLTGSNDGAVISGTDAGTVIEDTQLTTGGQLTVTDIDDQESAFTAQANTAGSYGSFTLAADGHWTYTLDNSLPAVQALGQNATLTDSLTVQSVDGTTHTITVTINGHDDGAVIAGVDSGTVTEDANLTAGQLETRGQLTISDPDAGQDHFTAQTNVAGSYGSFSLDQAGHWTYVSDNSQTAIQQLKAGETLTDSLTVQSVGGTTHTVTVTITGSNDAPVLTAQSQSITEDGTKLTGQMVATDVDTGDTLTFSLANAVDGFTLNADGSYSFAPANAAYQHLAAGQTETLTIPITVTDSTGATSTANLTITLTGSNDGAIISGTDADTVTEDTQLTTGGQLTVTDIDDQESAFTAQVKTAGSYGSFTLAADGHWTYTLDNSLPAVQALGQNATLTDSLTVQSVDGTTHTVTVNINGHDDGAVITGVDSGTVTEDSNVTTGKITTSGQLTISDPDAGQDHFTAQTHVAGSYGSFSLDADGQWNYSADNSQTAIQQLKAGETLTDSLTVQSVGGTTHTVTVTITGSNDAPVLTAQSQSVSEDGTQLSGQMVATDVDSGDSQTFSTTAQTAGFTLNADGSYSFDPSNAAYQHLPAGQTETLSIPITVTDNAGATSTANLTITLTGSNDGAIISGTDAGTVTEDTQLTTGGQLTVTDIDDQESAFTAQAKTAGSYGSFTLAADGHWTYTLDNKNSAVQALGQNATLTDSLTVQSVDGTTHKVTVTINGHDDGAVIAGVDSGAVTEDANLTAGQLETHGQLTISDPDAGQDHFTAQTNVAGSYGTFSLDADGQWHYSADNSQTAIQQLKAGATLTDSFTVTSADGTNHTVTVTLTGSNDAPVLTAQSQSVMEDGSRLSGQMVATDVDQGDTLHFSIGTRVAGFTLNADGSYNFDPSNAAYQHLAAGQTQTLAIPVTVTDSAGATSTANLTITLTGTNDGATLTDHGTPGQIKEDLHTTIEGHLSVRDVDSGEGLFPAQQGAGLSGYGSFILTPQANGQAYWRYSVDNSKTEIQQLGEGQLLHDSFTVHSADGTTHTISVDIVGTHDVPVLTAQSQSVTEDGSLLTGQMVATDVDTGDTLTFSLANAVDGFTLNADGSYSFDPTDAAYQHLAQGQTETLSIPITVTDSAGATSTANLTITLTGSNDGAVISGTDAGTVTEDTQLTTSGQLAVTDIDDQESAFTAQANTAGSYGSFTLAADGRWTYTLDNTNPTVQALSQTGTLTDSLTVQSVDGTTHTVTVTINGHDDGAVIAGVDSGTVTEDANLTAGKLETHGQLTISDPDAGQDHFTAQTNVAGSYGTFSLDADGQWHYSADNSQTAIQQLKAGETLTDSLTVQSVGGTTHTVTITLTGSNDAPVLTAQSQSVTEDGSLLTGQMVATDVDTGDTLTFSLANSVDGFTLNADGSYSFDPSNAAYQHLTQSQTLNLTIPITVTDSAGASSTQNLSLNLTGTNDGAVIGGDISAATTEDSTQATRGRLTITDVDDGEAHFVAQSNTAGTYGSFTLLDNGQWSYQLDNSKHEVQALKDGQQVTDTFTVTSADGGLHQVTVTITGKNDAAVITGEDHQTLTEDQNVSGGQLIAQGQLHASTPDAGGDQFTPLSDLAGKFGHLSLGADGHWVYKADNNSPAVQALGAGQSATESFTVHSADGTAHTLSLSIQGADEILHDLLSSIVSTLKSNVFLFKQIGNAIDAKDAGSLGNVVLSFYGGNPHVVDADGHVLASGSNRGMFGYDIGLGQVVDLLKSHPGARLVLDGPVGGSSAFYLHDSGDQGQLHFAGNARYNVHQNTLGSVPIDGLPTPLSAAGAVPDASDSLTISVTDIRVDHAGQLQTSGQLGISDADAGESHFNAQQEVAGTYGSFSIDASGHWVYSVDNGQSAVQNLQAGAQLTDSFLVTSADGTSHVVSVAVYGKNDAPVLFAQTQSVSEDGALLSGQMQASDADAGDTLSFHIDQPVAGLTLNADGSYSFDPSNAAYQHLAAGRTETLTIPVTVTDGAGASSTQNLTITLTGTNDGATITDHGTPGQIKEDQHTAIEGHLSVGDVDSGEGLFPAQQGAGLSGYGGFTLTPQANGQAYWRYSVDNSKTEIQQLGEGQLLHDSFTVHSADGTTHTISVDIVGTNDAPVLTAQSQSVTEDGSLLTGQMVATDVDTGDTLTFSLANSVDGFTLNADGSYSFEPIDAAYQHLAQGQTETLTIPVSVTDSAGATSTQQLVITVSGSNDGAVISGIDAGSVTEDTQLTTQGQLTVTDIDDQEAAFTAQTKAAGSYGSFTLAADGHWTYTLDNTNPTVQALSQTGTLTDSLTVQSVDGTTHQITVTINGHDDGAVIAGVDSGTVTEDANLTADQLETHGKLTITDPDTGQDHFTAQTNVAGSYGTFSLDADGQWHYSADNSQTAIQQLKAGETLTDSITVQSVGGTTHTVTITINGHDDGAVIAGVDSGTVTEDANLTAGQLETHGQLTISDPDAGQDHFTAQTNVAGSYGTFSLDADGQWRYSADNSQSAIQQLKAGETLTDSFTVTSADGTNHAVTVTLTGSNDAPVLTAQSQSVTEDGAKLTGQMVVTDVDTGDTLSFSLANGVDGFTLNTDGSYSFDPASAAYQHLAQGQTETLTIPITVTDSTGATSTANLTITLTGTNDGATISGVDTGRVIEDQNVDAQGLLHASGQLQIQDADAGQSNFVAQNGVATQYGHFSIDALGAWSYTVDNNKPEVQALKPGGTLGETGNMAQALGQALVQSTMEGFHAVGEALTQGQSGALAGVLDLTVQGAAIVLSGPSGTTPVVYAMDAQGRSTLGVDELLSWLHQGTGYEVHLQGSQSDVQFFVHDRGDMGVLHGLPLSGATMLTDPENAAVHLALAWQTPPLPRVLSEVVSVISAEGTTHQITLSIQGTAEDAVISGTDSGTVTEDQNLNAAHQLEARGQLQVTDADAGQAVFQPIQDLAGHYGHLSLDKNGAWVYQADNNSRAVQALVKGQTVSDSFVVHSFDGTAHTISVALQGVDDAYLDVMAHVANSLFNQLDPWPAIGGAISSGNIANLSGLELSFTGGTPTVVAADGHVLESFTHQDSFGTHIPLGHLVELIKSHPGSQLILEGTPGASSSFYVNNSGNPQQLDYAGSAKYDVAIRTLGSVPNHSLLNPHGSAAVLAGADGGSVLVDGDAQLQTQGHLTVLDADGDQAHFTAQQDVKGQYGQFSIDAQGLWHYQADGHQSALLLLAAGKSLSENFTVTSADGTSHTVTVQLFGSSQRTAATISGVDSGTLTEDTAQAQVSGQLSVVDPDAGEAHFIALADAKGRHGHFSLDEQGAWQYRLDNTDPAVQALKAGETLTDTLMVHSADGSSHELHITVQGSNDAPVLQAQSQSVTEDGSVLRGQMVAQDVDHGDVLTFSTNSTTAGFVLHDDGRYTFDPANTAYQHLAAGQTQKLTIPITVTDSEGASDTKNLIITITGKNDVPKVSQIEVLTAGREDAVLVLSKAQLLAHVSDVDGDNLSITNISSDHGSLVSHRDGSYTFTPAANYNGQVTFHYDLVDGHGGHVSQTATMMLSAAPDAAIISGQDSGSVTEDQHVLRGKLSTGGSLSVTDPDGAAESRLIPTGTTAGSLISGDKGLGQFEVGANGHWNFVANNADPRIQALGRHDTLQDTITVHSVDGTAHTITVTINGTNDAPTLAAQSKSVAENGAQLSGRMVATDVDTGDTQAFSTTAKISGFTLHADGSYTFDPSDAAYQHLAQGQTQTLTIPVEVRDGSGATATNNLTIQITGTNDRPQITGVTTPHTVINIDGGASGGGFSIVDGVVHAGAHQRVWQASDYAALSHNAHGSNSVGDIFVFSDAATVHGADGGGSVGRDPKDYIVLDKPASAYRITSSANHVDSGTNYGNVQVTEIATGKSWGTANNIEDIIFGDGTSYSGKSSVQKTTSEVAMPNLNGVLTVVEGGPRLTGHIQASDVDSGDTRTFSTSAHVAGFTLNSDGSFSFNPADAAYHHLAQGHKLSLDIPVVATDKHGTSDERVLHLEITGIDDSAVRSTRPAPPAPQAPSTDAEQHAGIVEDAHHQAGQSDLSNHAASTLPSSTDSTDESHDSVPVFTKVVTNEQGGTGSPLADYLHFADTSQHVDLGGAADGTAVSPLADYLGPYTFGELQLHAQTSSQSSDEANFETIDSVNLDVAEPATLATSAHDLDLASSGHLNVSSVNYDASLLMGSVDEQTAQTNPAQDKSVDTTLFEGGNFSAQATTSPIDHYLQMVGLMPNSIEQQPTAPIELATLNTPSSTFQDMDTDMLDMVTINHFENPLIEEHKTPHLDQYGFQGEHAQLEVNPNDDDLLHSALNDMHNQM